MLLLSRLTVSIVIKHKSVLSSLLPVPSIAKVKTRNNQCVMSMVYREVDLYNGGCYVLVTYIQRRSDKHVPLNASLKINCIPVMSFYHAFEGVEPEEYNNNSANVQNFSKLALHHMTGMSKGTFKGASLSDLLWVTYIYLTYVRRSTSFLLFNYMFSTGYT